jgi:hypothetical protein
MQTWAQAPAAQARAHTHSGPAERQAQVQAAGSRQPAGSRQQAGRQTPPQEITLEVRRDAPALHRRIFFFSTFFHSVRTLPLFMKSPAGRSQLHDPGVEFIRNMPHLGTNDEA